MVITPHMRQAGITQKLLEIKKNIRCPSCNFEFNLMHSRVIACQGCRYGIYGCNLIRCPRCDHEFQIRKTGLAKTRASAKSLDRYMSKILSNYFRDFGKKPTK